MRKLKFENIVGYFPYGLNMNLNRNNGMFKADNVNVDYCQINKNNSIYGWYLTYKNVTYGLFDIKPILHPLSEYCGKVIAKDVMSKLNCDLSTVYEIWELQGGEIRLDEISYKTHIVLCNNHVDFNDLIKDNLAINYNDLHN